MSKSETHTITLTAITTETRVQKTARGGEVEKMAVLEGTKVLVNGKIYNLSVYNGQITLDRWVKSPAPKTDGKSSSKDI